MVARAGSYLARKQLAWARTRRSAHAYLITPTVETFEYGWNAPLKRLPFAVAQGTPAQTRAMVVSSQCLRRRRRS
jgi:hypothetical protein